MLPKWATGRLTGASEVKLEMEKAELELDAELVLRSGGGGGMRPAAM